MKTFRQFIQEEMAVGSAFPISRQEMPQINNLDDFYHYVSQFGIGVFEAFGTIDHLRPTQHEFDQDKVDRIIDSGFNKTPIIISQDNFVLDGHHRYFAALQSNIEIRYDQLDANITDCLKHALDYVSGEKGSKIASTGF